MMGDDVSTRRGSIPVPIEERFWPKVDVRGPDECWEWQAARSWFGYGVIGKGGQGHGNMPAHRWLYQHLNGSVTDDVRICHTCDNPPCVNPAHLFAGSHLDNMRDMTEKGRSLRGERHNLVELTESEVVDMRRMWENGGTTQIEIAKRFNTTKANVSQIVRGKRWRHILPDDWQPPVRAKWSRAS